MFFFHLRDPASFVALVFLIVAVQAVVWLIGRHSLDLEWWRSLPLTVVLWFASSFIVHGGFSLDAMAGAHAASALLIWILAGYLYEPEFRQRLLLALLLPLLAYLALPLGLLVRKGVFGY